MPPETVDVNVVVLPTHTSWVPDNVPVDGAAVTIPVIAIFSVVAPVDVIAMFPLGLPVAEAANRT